SGWAVSPASVRSPSVRSSRSETSASPSGPCSALPAKMTSSIAPPRRCFGLCSPRTQRMASTTFDFPQPFGPTIAVTPAGSSSTVRALDDLKPISSVCLIPIPSPIPHAAAGRASACDSFLEQFRVPVRRVHAAQERQPFLVAPRAERLQHEGCPLRPERMPDELHPGLERRAPALHAVAAVTGADDVLPHRGPALRARDDVVEIQLRTRVATPAVLTPVVVAGVDVESAEADVAARDPIVAEQQDHPRDADGAADQADGVIVGGEVRPAREVERPVLVVDRAGDVLVEQRQG